MPEQKSKEPQSFRAHEQRLAKYQEKMSRKVKGSSNHKKAKKVQKIQVQIAQVRKDFLHKESTKLVDHYAMIAIEDLKIKNMSASAKGTLEPSKKRGEQVGT